MSVKFNCDICQKLLKLEQRTSVKLSFVAVEDICPTCKDGLKLSIELAKVGPHWEQVGVLHSAIFSARMKHLRERNGLAK